MGAFNLDVLGKPLKIQHIASGARILTSLKKMLSTEIKYTSAVVKNPVFPIK
jgi:hypothetical protein